MRNTRRLLTLTFCVALVGSGGARTQDPIDRITEADLKDDLFTLAGDAMRGREGGTLDEMAASVWLAERARAAGMLPAGDNGTYFQFFPLERLRVSTSSSVTLGGKVLEMGRDVVADAPVWANMDAPVIVASAESLSGPEPKIDIKGQVLAVRYAPAPEAAAALPALRNWLRGVQKSVAAQSPAAIVAIVPEEAADQWA